MMIPHSLKRIVPLVLALLVLLTVPLSVSAAEFDISKTGTIKIQLRDVYFPDRPIGGTVVLHKVGDAKVENSNLTFALTTAFSGSGVSLADVNAPDLAAQLADYASENNLAGTSVQADANGYATFSGLSTGLYLVVQAEAVDGYLTVTPFLVSLPMYNGENGWIYNIEAAPKVQRPPKDEISVTVVKKWQDNNKKRPDTLTVHLLKEGETADTVVLTAADSWKYTWDHLNPYYSWTVKEDVPDGYKATYSVYKNTTTITNRASWYVPPEDVLIQTGQLNWPVPILVCTGLCFLLIGCILLRKGKRDV